MNPLTDKKYLGIPFVKWGKDFTGADCAGLTELFIKTEIDPDFCIQVDVKNPQTALELTNALLPHLRPDWKRGDILLFKSRNGEFATHLCPALSEIHILTTGSGTCSFIWNGLTLATRSKCDFIGAIGHVQAREITREICNRKAAP